MSLGSTNAMTAAAYASRGAPSRMVDFCLAINPDHAARHGPDVAAIETQLRPGRDINHSSRDALLWTPIAVSIEAKRAMVEGAAAELPLGVRQSSLLRMLMRAVEALASEASIRATDPPAADATPSQSAASEWLPGIIVHGHKWAFVAICRTGLCQNRPVFLSSIDKGGTETPLDVYCLLVTIAYLRKWAEETY